MVRKRRKEMEYSDTETAPDLETFVEINEEWNKTTVVSPEIYEWFGREAVESRTRLPRELYELILRLAWDKNLHRCLVRTCKQFRTVLYTRQHWLWAKDMLGGAICCLPMVLAVPELAYTLILGCQITDAPLESSAIIALMIHRPTLCLIVDICRPRALEWVGRRNVAYNRLLESFDAWFMPNIVSHRLDNMKLIPELDKMNFCFSFELDMRYEGLAKLIRHVRSDRVLELLQLMRGSVGYVLSQGGILQAIIEAHGLVWTLDNLSEYVVEAESLKLVQIVERGLLSRAKALLEWMNSTNQSFVVEVLTKIGIKNAEILGVDIHRRSLDFAILFPKTIYGSCVKGDPKKWYVLKRLYLIMNEQDKQHFVTTMQCTCCKHSLLER